MDGVTTILNLVGAVALLLWGVRMVRTGLTRAFSATLRKAIGACSRNRFTAMAGGVGLTALLQSSTATALLLASFAGRGLITLPIAIAVMLGANIGTTLTSQVPVVRPELAVAADDRHRRHRLPVGPIGQDQESWPRGDRARPHAAVAEAAVRCHRATGQGTFLHRRDRGHAGRVCHRRTVRRARHLGGAFQPVDRAVW